MSLAARIDCLRGRAAPLAGVPGATSTSDTCDLANTADLPNASDSRRGAAVPCEVLAEVLGAEVLSTGLLVRERDHALPSDALQAVDLNALPEACHLGASDWVYIDTETTGLSGGAGNLAFMVGTARYVGDGVLRVRQYVLGSYAAEAGMLRDLVDWVGSGAVLVSYNGKSFDLPLLVARCRMQRIEQALDQLAHLDLMYTVRRAFRRDWPDCRLQTAERCLLDLQRHDDLPGALVPAAWQRWLRAGETAQLAAAVRHNWQDVVSLALLQRGLVGAYAAPEHALDAVAVARAWRVAGRGDRERWTLESAEWRLDPPGQLQLAALYRRQGEWARAEALWLALHAKGDVQAACELSKYYEHRRHDYVRAIDYATHCVPAEREARLGRLWRKRQPVRQMSLWPSGSSLER